MMKILFVQLMEIIMFDIILACLFIYIFVMVLMGMFVVCVYLNDMFVASCEDIKGFFKK